MKKYRFERAKYAHDMDKDEPIYYFMVLDHNGVLVAKIHWLKKNGKGTIVWVKQEWFLDELKDLIECFVDEFKQYLPPEWILSILKE